MNSVFSTSAIVLYLLCTLLMILRLQSKTTLADKSIFVLLLPGFAASLLHAYGLTQYLMTENGLQFGVFNAASAISLINSVMILLLTLKRRTELLTSIVLPLAALSIVLEIQFPNSHLLPANSPLGLQIHIVVSIIAYSLLGLAALFAIILAIQNRLLHNHHPGGLMRRLPSLQTTEKLLFDTIFAGFISLSLALLSGFAFLEDMFAQHLAHKTLLAIVAWLVFAILLIGRIQLGWRGRIAIRWTLAGFITLMLAYFGSKFAMEFVLT